MYEGIYTLYYMHMRIYLSINLLLIGKIYTLLHSIFYIFITSLKCEIITTRVQDVVLFLLTLQRSYQSKQPLASQLRISLLNLLVLLLEFF